MMNTNKKVIWHEGMFLQPQHFQQHDRYLENMIHHKQVALEQNTWWGFSELTLDRELLSIGKLGLASGCGIFPDGTTFNMPKDAPTPAAMNIVEGLSNTLLYLALPIRKPGIAEVGQQENGKIYRYTIEDNEVADHVAGNNEIAEVQLGSLACCLMSEHEDLSGYSLLPIARIEESRTNHQITLDKSFIPPLLDVQATTSLSHMITEIHGLLNHRAQMLAGRLTDTQQAGTAEIIDFMLLQLVNRYEPLFHYMAHKKPLHPEVLFSTFIQLMGEMATYTDDKRRPIEPPIYRHGDLFNTFKPVIQSLRHALSMVLEQNATAIPLESRGMGTWVGQIHDKSLIRQSSFILAVYADIPVENIRTHFPSQVKIGPVEQIRTLVSRALPGIDVSPIAVAPRQIPYHASFSYFAVNTQHPLWKELEKSGGIAFQVSKQYPGLKLELWAIKG